MAKGFKFKISKLFFSFKFCRSNESSSPHDPSIQPSKRHRYSFKRHVSYVFGCGVGAPYASDIDRTESTSQPPPPTPSFMWENQGEWHVIARDAETSRRKIYDGRSNDEVLRSEKSKRRASNTKTARRSRISVSSSADGEEETESLMMAASSSASFSTEQQQQEEECSSTINCSPHVIAKRHRNSISASSTSSGSSLVRRFVPCTAAAVVKNSKDPYEDFKGSMVEMILEKEMFHERDLEELLSCFLALNSSQHHGVIVMAFSEIWNVLFSGAGVRRSSFKSPSSYASNS